MPIKYRTIKGSIFIWSFFSASILLIAVCFCIYFQVRNAVFDSADHLLHSNMQLIAGLIEVEGERIDLELSDPVYGEYSIPRSGHYYQLVIHDKQKRIVFSPSLVKKDFHFDEINLISHNKDEHKKIFISKGPDNEPLRVLHKQLLAFGIPVDLYIGESMVNNFNILEKIRTSLFILVPLTVILIGFTSYLTARRSLKPLENFSDEIKQITHKNLNRKIELVDSVLELDNLKESFNNMLERIKKAFDLEKLIISEASHQLKTPVSVIKSYCDITLQKERDIDEYTETLITIKETSENMGKLINNMLLLARLDSGAFKNTDFQVISLNECIENTLKIAKHLSEDNQIRLIFDNKEDTLIQGNKEKLTEAFLNIMENGIKYNQKNGFVKVSIKKENGYAKINFEDSGIGIQDSESEKIFEKFYRSGKNPDIEGTGLGLSIAKAIIDIHGGSIEVSNTGSGSSFIVKMPSQM